MLALRRLALSCSSPVRGHAGWRVGGALARKKLSSEADRDVRVELLKDEFQGVAVFAMNRPAAKNAISKNLLSQLEDGISLVKHNKDVRVVILKSDVPGAFCAGADLKERKQMKEEEVGPFVTRARRAITDLSELPLPVIAALDGIAYGGGLEIALAADIRIASEDAKMGLVETKLAIIPGAGGTQRLPRLVGIAKAKEMIFTAQVVSGREALEVGLVEHAVPQNADSDAAYRRALNMANEIKGKGPIAISMAKIAITNGMQTDLNTAMRIEEACYAQVIPTEDRMEGIKAFIEKRAPVYKGK